MLHARRRNTTLRNPLTLGLGITAAGLIMAGASTAPAAVIYGNDITNGGPNDDGGPNVSDAVETVAPGTSGTAAVSGSGFNETSYISKQLGGGSSDDGWKSTASAAVSSGETVSWSVNADLGNAIDFDNLQLVTNSQNNGEGTYTAQADVGNGFFDIGTFEQPDTGGQTTASTTFDLSTDPRLQLVTSADFRVAVYSTAGKNKYEALAVGSRFDDSSKEFADGDIVLNGTVFIPEPASLALMGIGGLLMLGGRRRHGRA